MAVRAVNAVKGHRHGRVPRAFREEQLLNIAEHLFGQQGYQGTSVENIAAAAKVTRPMVYNYFKSKDGIYLACLRKAREKLAAGMINAVTAAKTPSERLTAGMDAYFSFVEHSSASWDVLFGGGAAVAGPAVVEADRLRNITTMLIVGFLKNDVKPGVDDEMIVACAHVLSGGGEQLAKWWRKNPDTPRSRVVELFSTLYWNGLKPIVR
ncbi:TetR/AcrR family transcriptional regulator [Stenotrophobium rhamnosiphilum]|uniref:HTH tetR-type domain-containing protein n=1 Tax=Stenotrophobium rhamnosiphilum TaxID=2029166 RepID=A0A2T5MIZ7_9GAMM|nr:TetR/AcrR family transcriptional regulator [Stenotrophobium rhamnosiphilum]PTU32556.1 hypothetical protein CJD38_00030 [Stenotrophobium rhamnosiphilum]